jgi:hypothetical protein
VGPGELLTEAGAAPNRQGHKTPSTRSFWVDAGAASRSRYGEGIRAVWAHAPEGARAVAFLGGTSRPDRPGWITAIGAAGGNKPLRQTPKNPQRAGSVAFCEGKAWFFERAIAWISGLAIAWISGLVIAWISGLVFAWIYGSAIALFLWAGIAWFMGWCCVDL